jgi:lipoprotein-anchoring transpeptidase ErfK/SrfK
MRRNEEQNGRQGKRGRIHLIAATLMLVAARALAQQQAAGGQPTAVPQSEPERRIVVSIPDRKLALIEDGRVVKVYPVAVGKKVSASPTGDFKIINRVKNPTYYHSGTIIPPGKDNPVGTRWIGLSLKGYGIHGTNEPRSIGKAASHGCIRMAKADLEQLFNLVGVGDAVEIAGARTTAVAQIFGGEPVVVAAAEASIAGQN